MSMNTNRKFIAWFAGVGLSLAAASAQAGNVGFSITYSDYDRHSKHNYRSHVYPANHVVHYNYHPYGGVKHYKRDRHHKRDRERSHKRHHYNWWYPNHYYDRHHYKHHRYEHKKHSRHHDVYYYREKRKHFGGYGGHYHGNAYCNIRH